MTASQKRMGPPVWGQCNQHGILLSPNTNNTDPSTSWQTTRPAGPPYSTEELDAIFHKWAEPVLEGLIPLIEVEKENRRGLRRQQSQLPDRRCPLPSNRRASSDWPLRSSLHATDEMATPPTDGTTESERIPTPSADEKANGSFGLGESGAGRRPGNLMLGGCEKCWNDYLEEPGCDEVRVFEPTPRQHGLCEETGARGYHGRRQGSVRRRLLALMSRWTRHAWRRISRKTPNNGQLRDDSRSTQSHGGESTSTASATTLLACFTTMSDTAVDSPISMQTVTTGETAGPGGNPAFRQLARRMDWNDQQSAAAMFQVLNRLDQLRRPNAVACWLANRDM